MREICTVVGPRQQTPATGFPTCDDADMMHRHRICAGQGVVSIPTIPQRGTWEPPRYLAHGNESGTTTTHSRVNCVETQ